MYGAYSLLFYVAIAKDVCYYTSILSPIPNSMLRDWKAYTHKVCIDHTHRVPHASNTVLLVGRLQADIV